MAMLADTVELARRGRHPQRHHTAAVVTAATGAALEQATVPATRPATGSCCSWPTNNQARACGRSRAPVATAPA